MAVAIARPPPELAPTPAPACVAKPAPAFAPAPSWVNADAAPQYNFEHAVAPDENGYVADVKYEEKAVFPPEIKPFHTPAPPAQAPAPAYAPPPAYVPAPLPNAPASPYAPAPAYFPASPA